jgi:hypothetical protein
LAEPERVAHAPALAGSIRLTLLVPIVLVGMALIATARLREPVAARVTSAGTRAR